MAATPYETAEAFLNKLPRHNGAFVSHGDTLYSYGQKIAHWENDHIVIDCLDKPSVTTARHVAAFSRTIAHWNQYVEGSRLVARRA